ncbi:hypothetical protein [Nonomuraea sp. LPB2021202275-12-8]|uniref:hypothetical protein n=1 Tax=Nonomuraea sp. LPB2021202275-12-8 TaxID=3120159 RepID=UPI00300D8DF6
MDTASSAQPELEHLVRRMLIDAGFVVEPSTTPADGGLSVWPDPGRGVVIRWGVPGELPVKDRGRYDTIRTAVRLALRTILAAAGFVVEEEYGRPELVVVSRNGSVRSADGGVRPAAT